jgi:hypothetical protein
LVHAELTRELIERQQLVFLACCVTACRGALERAIVSFTETSDGEG